MEAIGIFWSPIYSGILGGLAVMLMVFLANDKTRTNGEVHFLEFGLFFKFFSVALIPCAFFMVYVMYKSSEGQEIIALLLSLGFIAGAIFFPYQSFFVKFSYDNENVYFKSPIAGDKKSSWKNLDKVGYSLLLQADYIVVDGIGKIWCSNMLNGYSELMAFIDKKQNENE